MAGLAFASLGLAGLVLAGPPPPKGFVNDGLEMLDHFSGRRFVIVQFIHIAQVFIVAEAEAVIRQQLVFNHVLGGHADHIECIDPAERLIEGIAGPVDN